MCYCPKSIWHFKATVSVTRLLGLSLASASRLLGLSLASVTLAPLSYLQADASIVRPREILLGFIVLFLKVVAGVSLDLQRVASSVSLQF